MEDKIRSWYEFLIDICERSRAATVLAEKIYLDFDNKSTTRDIEIITIISLYHSAAINLFQIFDTDSCSLSVHQFRSDYYGEKSKKPKFEFDKKAFDRLHDYRNKLLAHADQGVFFDGNLEELHLYIEDLKSLLKSIEDELFPLAKAITGEVFGKDCTTDEWFFPTTRNVEVQYEGIRNAAQIYKKMYAYMKENCKMELFEIINEKGDNINGQTKNANP